MSSNLVSCSKIGHNKMECRYCLGRCVKNGYQKKGTQRIKCKNCGKRQQFSYKYQRYRWRQFDELLKSMICNGLGIRNISRILRISCSTVLKHIRKIANQIKTRTTFEADQKYEVDELFTYVGNKKNIQWIMYAMNRETKRVIDFVVGARTSENAKILINKLLDLNPTKIYTDRLNIYPNLILNEIHSIRRFGTNHIERNNLTLRTNLKRLQRRSICYSKSKEMLENCLKIYFEVD